MFGERAPETATHLNQLGLLLGRQGDSEGSETALREALEIARAAHGAEHPEVATILVNLANTLVREGRLTAAEPFYREGIAMEVRLRGTDHPRYAVKLHNFAVFLHAAGRFAEAAELHRAVVATLEDTFGDDHPHTGAAFDSLASDLAAAGRFEEAWPLFTRAGRVLTATAGEQSTLFAIHRWRLARALCDAGRPAEALEPVNAALAILEPLGESQERQVALALGVRADVHAALGSAPEAEADLRRAVEIQRRLYPPGHFGLGRTLHGLARVLLEVGRIAEAGTLAREAEEILAGSLAEDHAWRAEARATRRAVETAGAAPAATDRRG